MKKLITTSIISILLIGVSVALNLSNVAGVIETPVKLGGNHVAIEQSAFDKNGKKIVLGYSEHYGHDGAMELWTDANRSETFWDMNDVEAVAYVAGEKTKATADKVKYQAILDKF